MCVASHRYYLGFIPISIQANYEILRQAIRLRASLIPYIYTYARWAYDEGKFSCMCNLQVLSIFIWSRFEFTEAYVL